MILVLWVVPRSTSTAFGWMMRMRGDMTCFHEPYARPWFRGESPLWPRIRPDDPRIPGLTFAKVTEDILAAARERPVFVKDMPTHVDHLWHDPAFLAPFTNTFLIRHPAKVLASILSRDPGCTHKELGFADQRALFNLLCQRDGVAPPVIDSDDLLADPHGVVKTYCTAAGIEFRPEALEWEPGPRTEVSWWDQGSWHDTLRKSDGLKPQPHVKLPDVDGFPDDWKRHYEAVLPHYERLHAHRLRVDDRT